MNMDTLQIIILTAYLTGLVVSLCWASCEEFKQHTHGFKLMCAIIWPLTCLLYVFLWFGYKDDTTV